MTDLLPLLLLCGVASAALTALAIAYARRANLLDLPGQRRSHSVPTPRGGGIGIVAVALALAMWTAWTTSGDGARFAALCAGAIALVAAVGWIDDHRGLGARWRLLAHLLAAGALVLYLPGLPAQLGLVETGSIAAAVAALSIALLAVAWSINLHNFMDGINGLLGWQAVFVFGVLALGDTAAPHHRDALCWAAAVVGFLPFNFPRARVFMGDVGSGVIGLLVAVLALREFVASGSIAAALVACSAFVVDATCTLLSRFARGKRWYGAHREHLYQWLVRSGATHAQAVSLYMAWNLFVALPVIGWLRSVGAPSLARDASVVAVVYGVGIAVWIGARHGCLRRAKNAIKP